MRDRTLVRLFARSASDTVAVTARQFSLIPRAGRALALQCGPAGDDKAPTLGFDLPALMEGQSAAGGGGGVVGGRSA